MKSWFTIRNQTGTPEILIYDEIGMWGVTAADFARAVRALGDVDALTLRINSPGGSVFDALAIHNTLVRHPATVTGYIDGIAASAASVIAMAADRLIMPANTFMMIHDPSGLVMGDADDMREFADVLDRIKTGLVASYLRKVGDNLSADDISAMLTTESWLTAEEAVGFGFADEIEDAIKIAAIALDRFDHPPEALKSVNPKVDPPKPPSVADPATVADLFAEADAAQYVSAMLKRRPTDTDVTAELDRISGIRDICAAAELDADAYIRAGMSAEQMTLVAAEIKAAVDTHIDTHQPPPAEQKPAISTAKIYAARRQLTVVK